jgi:hypothetical protein
VGLSVGTPAGTGGADGTQPRPLFLSGNARHAADCPCKEEEKMKRFRSPLSESSDLDDSVVVFRLWWVLLAVLGVSIVVLAVWTSAWLVRVVTHVGA